ncbi:hypothetical protein MNBD_GAMMA10-1584 [hydrothermal vent metagenome]|uniref:Uncharacterized protein n=1 Tax=hydrothermal vent metagenome TaxID=652676 RepID=A0A3B0XRS4_9ZZZZ
MDKPVHSIEYKISSLFVDDGLENGVTEINGEVLIPDDEADELIAKCRYFFIDIDNSEYAIDYLLDVKGETAAFIALYDVSTSSFTDDIMNMFKGDLRYLNILRDENRITFISSAEYLL